MKKIYINPGHSNTDPGAVGFERERDLNVKVSAFMEAYLLENFQVEVRQNPGTLGGLYAICKDANDWVDLDAVMRDPEDPHRMQDGMTVILPLKRWVFKLSGGGSAPRIPGRDLTMVWLMDKS